MNPVTRRNLLLAGLGGGTAVLVGGALFLPGWQAEAEGLTMESVLFDPDNPVLGNPDGDVTIVEFFDYQCPYCKLHHADLLDVVRQDGNTRLVMKDWPIFGAPSVRASQLTLGAEGLGLYEEASTALMATKGRLSEAQITAALSDAGLDVAALDAAYRRERARWDGLITRNDFQAVQIGLQGTPAFIIGQTIYAGAMERAELEEAIAKSRRLSAP